MSRVFVTGSADGLGHLAAKALIKAGHRVMLHARNEERARETINKTPGAEDVLIADLSSIEATKALAHQANATGRFDAVIHNAAVYQVPKNSLSAEGYSLLFIVNSLAAYILTCLMEKPSRLIYMSSGMHMQADTSLGNLSVNPQKKNSYVSYSDSKFHNLL